MNVLTINDIERVRDELGNHWNFSVVLPVLVLAGLGYVMVFSSTVASDAAAAQGHFGTLVKHSLALAVGLLTALLVRMVPPTVWRTVSAPMYLFAVVALLLVLVPGIGIEVNGSRRWFDLGPFNLQPSEFTKVATIVFLAGYFHRHGSEVIRFREGVLKVALVTSLATIPIVLEPDLGNAVVLGAAVLGMMFLAGVRLFYLLLSMSVVAAAGVVLTVVAPYRMARVTSFLDPFADPYGAGFQLVQALIAFGRGDWFGAGLGHSVQKLFYLPHANNDFLVAVVAEELGLAGVLVVVVMVAALLRAGMKIAAVAQQRKAGFDARLAEGLTLLIVLQSMIHLGVNMGVLPTKGLTMPLMSYGGSSLTASFLAIGLLLSVDRANAMAVGKKR